MSFAFLNPLMLFGLALALLPIIIHRLTHRKALRKDFSAVRLLLHSRNLMAKPHRLKHIMLLTLRIMAVAALVLVASRPMLVRPGLLAVREGAAKVIILDNSASMGYRDVQGQRYEHAKEAALEIIQTLGSTTDEVAIITMAPPEYRGRMTKQEAADYVASIPLSMRKGEAGVAMAMAFQKLKSARGAKEIILISDTAKSDWQKFDLTKAGTIPADLHVIFLRIGGKTRDSNIAVKEVRLSEGELIAGTSIRLETTIANLSDETAVQPTSTVIRFTIARTKTEKIIPQIKAGENGTAYFDLLLDRPGFLKGQVRLPADNLPYDDIFDVTLNVREKMKVLIVDGDPRGSMRSSESYYLRRALQPAGAELSPFQIKTIAEREYSDTDLKTYEALFLLNVAKPLLSKVKAFVDGGKTVFIFLGDRVQPEEYNYMHFFPWRLGGVREANEQRPESVGSVNYDHKALKQFSEAGKGSLEGAVFHKYVKVDGSAKTLLALRNKDPLLMESPFGRGKIFLYTSSADADWNDLPLKAAYVPLVQGILKEGVRTNEHDGSAQERIGEPAIPPPESDLTKLSDEDISNLLSGLQVQVKEYRKSVSQRTQGRNQELWFYLLGFLALVLAIETGLANRL